MSPIPRVPARSLTVALTLALPTLVPIGSVFGEEWPTHSIAMFLLRPEAALTFWATRLQAAFADISANDRFNGDFAKGLPAIGALAIVVPCETDLYFRVRDNQARSRANAERRIAANSFDPGTAAGGGLNPGDNTFSGAALTALFA
jgi:hypothetical protein